MNKNDLSKFNFKIQPRFIHKNYIDIIDKFIRNITNAEINRLIDDNVKFNNDNIQDKINNFKNNELCFITNGRYNDNLYMGKLIKNSCITFKTLGEGYYYTTTEKILDDQIYRTQNIIEIYDNYEDVPENKKNIVQDEIINIENPIVEREINPIANSNDLQEFMKIQNMMYELYVIDKEYFIKKIKQLKKDMKIEDLIMNEYEDESDIKNIKSCISFYDELRSNLKVKKERKGRLTHNKSLEIACKTYKVEKSKIQSLLGSRSNFNKF